MTQSLLSRYGVALLATAVGIYVRFLLNPLLGNDAPLLISLGAVALAAWHGGMTAGLLAAVLSALGGLFLVLPPLGDRPAPGAAFLVRLCLFTLAGALVSGLTGALQAAARERRRAERVSRGQAAALGRTLDALTAAPVPALDTFLAQVLAAAAEQLGARSASLWFYDKERAGLSRHLTCAAGGAPPDVAPGGAPVLLSREIPLWQEILRTHRPVVVADVATDPRVAQRERLREEGGRALLLAPLFLRGDPVGVLSIHDERERPFDPEEIELARALAQQAALAVQLTHLAGRSREAAVLEERNRLAREIHDTLAQGFTGVVVQLEAAEDALGDDPGAAVGHLSRARGLARESLAEARRSVLALRPRAREHGGLPAALARHIEAMTAGVSPRVELAVRGAPPPLPDEAEGDLLRIGLEALTNALKHAQARAVQVELSSDAGGTRLSVRDDGCGFDTGAPPMGSGFGLAGMRERAERIGGRLTIRSGPGEGTEVAVVVPAPCGAERADTP